MSLKITELNRKHAREICDDWKYEGEYAIYNVTWDEAVRQNWSIADDEKRAAQFRGVFDENDLLIGFFRMTEDDKNEVEIGMGMRPERCGIGLGKTFVDAVTAYAIQRFPKQKLYLEVRPFNRRAICCYRKSGYNIKYQHEKSTPSGKTEYVRMEFER